MNDFHENEFNWDLKNNLEKLLPLVEKLPMLLPEDIKINADNAFRELESVVAKSIKLLEKYEIEINRFRQRACEIADDTYYAIKKSNESMYSRLEDLSRLKEVKCHIPYNFTEMIAISERLGNLTNEQFERLIALAKAFSIKEVA